MGTIRTRYEAYGAYARTCSDPLILAGRNRFHRDQIDAIIADVRAKLRPRPGERLLDIGCNVGLLLTALAADFDRCVGQDHEDLLAAYRSIGVPANVDLIAGFWPDVQPEGAFDCILAYSVLSVLPDASVARRFIDAASGKLAPGGRLLLGDVANNDARTRFLASSEGQRVSAEYAAQRQRDREADATGEYVARDRIDADVHPGGEFLDDEYVLGTLTHARRSGLEAYLLPQPAGLPFHLSREDILIVRRL
jgi:SAM-dependent methyltransferase